MVMTTEILLQMLYNSSEVINELEWVIFDEVHYCNDPERGHVWEKVFILLPDHISLVLLSATVANIPEYADWLGRTRNKKTYVISTTKRPVPLEHFIYIGKGSSGKEEKFQFIDADSKLQDQGYRDAMFAMKEKESNFVKKFGPKSMNPQSDRNFYIGMIRHLEKDDKLPVIVFTLSRKRCDHNAASLSQSLDLSTGEEKARAHQFIMRSLSSLKPHDRQIRQVVEVTDMLKKGFGLHHSGVLPLLKEITEILFTQGLVKVLFATETFAMGVNMPARSVAFDSVEKHDGIQKRNLLASEYIQMAGRAGRRGKDKTGTVLVLCKQSLPELNELHKMALGKPAQIVSQFRLTYSMILNLIRLRHNMDIESIMGRSFIEHAKQKRLETDMQNEKKLTQQVADFQMPDCELCSTDLTAFCRAYLVYVNHLIVVVPDIVKACMDKKVFKPGRLVVFEAPDNPFSLGIVLDYKKRTMKSVNLTILSVNAIELLTKGPIHSDLTSLKILTITEDQLHAVLLSNQDVVVDSTKVIRERSLSAAEKVNTADAIKSLFSFLKERNHELGITSSVGLFLLGTIDIRRDLKLNSLDFMASVDKMIAARNRLLSFVCIDCPDFNQHFVIGTKKVDLEDELSGVRFSLSPESMRCLPEYKQRLKVLEDLNYINSEGVLDVKGQVACLFSEHEVVMTEIIFDNVLRELEPEEIAAVLSGFVYQQKEDNPPPNPKVEQLKTRVIEVARRVGLLQQKYGMMQCAQDFVDELHFGLMSVTYEWAQGKALKDVVEGTNIQEGIIVRTLQRLDEVIADIRSAAELFGDQSLGDGSSLVEKMEQTSKCIRRDIVFAGSLYTQPDPDDN